MEKLKKFILEQVAAQKLSQADAKAFLLEMHEKEKKGEVDVAVIGIATRFANTDTPTEYWSNLSNGVSCLVNYPAERKRFFSPMTDNPYYAEFMGMRPSTGEEEPDAGIDSVKAGYLTDIDKFDAAFFNIPPREAKFMDPAQRVFLESAWSAIEDAGYGGDKIYGTDTGVFVGRDCTSGTFYRFITDPDPMHLTGTWEGLLASRISYLYNLRGPAMVVDTACSSGLVAIHTAAQAIRSGECEMAIAGGISVGTSAQSNSEDGGDDVLSSVSSNDNKVRTFDKKSTGTVFGEGVATLILKPLSKAIEDGDHVYAVIKGSAANNDGASNGITSPNPLAQEEVILKAWAQADINPETINYVEAHGTGTLLGDPIEIKGLTNAFRRHTDKKQFCGIGSAKTNMGHLVGASGVAGIIKVILGLYNKQLPASLNFEEPNPHINFTDSPLYVVDSHRTWHRGEAPRRAGVSGFGFSGTNCHVVLEEAPEFLTKAAAATEAPQLVTISAKTKTALTELIKRYQRYIAGGQELNVEGIAYTANTGRGHYDYRVAMVVKNAEDLRNKITALVYADLEDLQLAEVYYGHHKVVSDKKKVKETGEISETEKRNLTKSAVDAVAAAAQAGDAAALAQLADLYRQGATVEWNKLYTGKKIRRVSLPVYAFDRTVYWGEIKKSKLQGSFFENNQEAIHPMIDKCVVKSFNQDIYNVKWKVDKHWVLSDHILFGSSFVPGTAYLEIAREIASKYYPNQGIELQNVVFRTPIVVQEDESLEAHYIVQKESDHLKFTVASKADQEDNDTDAQWVMHVEMKIYPLAETEERPTHPVHDLRHNRPDMNEIVVDVGALTTKSGVVTFGPRWLNVSYVAKGEKDVVAELELPNDLADDLTKYLLHPGMLDNAVNAATQGFGDGMYLPFNYKSFKMYDTMPKHFYTHIRKSGKEQKHTETLTFDISLIDENGKAFVEIEEYTIKKIQAHALKQLNKYNNYYQTKWLPQPKASEEAVAKTGKVLVLKDGIGLADQVIAKIQSDANEIIVAEIGSAFEQKADNQFVIDGTEEDYVKLFTAIGEAGVGTVLHMLTVQGANDLAAKGDLDAQVHQGLDSLFYISRASVAAKWKEATDFVIITDFAHEVTGSEAIVHPHNAAMLGLAKVVVQEYPNLQCRAIDIDELTSVDTIVGEVTHAQPGFRVALRNNERFVEQFSKVNWDAIKTELTDIKEEGVYVITGGTGGLGLAVANYLTQRNGKVNLALINRSKLPARDQWEAIISGGEQPKLAERLTRLIELEAAGATVAAHAADTSSEAEMQAVVADLKAQFGKINGIIHAAGVAGDGFLIRKEKSVFDEVVQPKVQGTFVLDRVTRDEEMDFFVTYSSISTLFGARGQGDYTAANTYLDSFANYRNKLGKRTITINWPAWSEVGMAVDFNVPDEVVLFKSVTNQQAFETLESLLNSDLTNVIPAELNLQMMSNIESELPILLAEQIKIEIGKFRNRQGAEAGGGAQRRTITDVTLSGKGEDEYTETERKIATIYAIGLNLATIDIFESFNSMGGDSILATELLKYIDREYPGVVDISDMFSYPTVSEMAEYIDNKRGVTSAPAAIAEVAATTEASEDQELSNLLDSFESGDLDLDNVLDAIKGDK